MCITNLICVYCDYGEYGRIGAEESSMEASSTEASSMEASSMEASSMGSIEASTMVLIEASTMVLIEASTMVLIEASTMVLIAHFIYKSQYTHINKVSLSMTICEQREEKQQKVVIYSHECLTYVSFMLCVCVYTYAQMYGEMLSLKSYTCANT
jgi:hypothetical protein